MTAVKVSGLQFGLPPVCVDTCDDIGVLVTPFCVIENVSVIVPVPGPLNVLIDERVRLNPIVIPGGNGGLLTT